MPSTSNSVRLHRVLRAPAERIYRAFLEPEAMCKWLPPYGFTAKVSRMDAEVGGEWRMSFTTFGTKHVQSFGGKYLELVPGQKLRYTSLFDDQKNLPGEMTTTVLLTQVSVGTEINITQEGIPAVIPAEACYLGWQESLLQLARLVEPEIPS